MFDHLRKADPEIYNAITEEIRRQEGNLELIASENFTSLAVMEATGSVMTNKYAEGYPAARWYGGCEHVDQAEQLAIDRAKALFGAEHANVQPHSGSQANIAVYLAVLEPGDKIMAMDLACGGHLTHGHPKNVSGRLFQIIPYGVSKQDERIDYDALAALAKERKPKLIMAGYSAYPRELDFKRFRQIADSVGAMLVVDMAHFAGLVAAGVHPNPVPYAEFVTTTTHKTLRGPRGGLILCREEFRKKINAQIFPGTQGGPLMHVIAAKAVALKEAMTPAFKSYQRQVVANARAIGAALAEHGWRIVSGGTDNHLVLADLTVRKLTGKEASAALDRARITVNKNAIPFDPNPPMQAGGIRIGTPAVTTRGMKEGEMKQIVGFIHEVLSNITDEKTAARVGGQVRALTERFPLYPELKP
ncbi:MAG: serine hydroxymethyltransferase [Candidatus Omnitrophica bacterium CG11_big_fil_rev_8_21_14_0_20_64_10]|nr:MAG: serine hydroxymethyltransferase [Candidatus Omnitrophica bacterium CG11_big_fil_rev_8_21_14_0_20_64_10]